jgi:hypothetical protein
VHSSQHTMPASETVSCNAQAPNRMSLEYVEIIRETHGKKVEGLHLSTSASSLLSAALHTAAALDSAAANHLDTTES